jgi:DNA-binding transcriptional MerR regulator
MSVDLSTSPEELAASPAALGDLIEFAVRRLTADPTAIPTPEELRAVSTIPGLPYALSIAETAEVTGLSAHTLRYYERIGLLDVPRDHNGVRIFDAATLRRVVFLARMRTSGMPIAQLRRYVELVDSDTPDSLPERLAIMRAHREALLRRLAETQVALAITDYKIASYAAGPTPDDIEEQK